MITQNTIEHLYIEIPNFKNKLTANFSYFIESIKKQLTFMTNKYQLNLKTIYIANKSSTILPLYFLEQLLILLKPLTTTVEEYNFECTINNTNITTLQLFSKFQINRLIWKIISFQNQLNNKYNYEQSIKIINDAINLKFTNFSIDLNYNICQQTLNDITNDLQICFNFQKKSWWNKKSHQPDLKFDFILILVFIFTNWNIMLQILHKVIFYNVGI